MAMAATPAMPMPNRPPSSDSVNRFWPGAGGAAKNVVGNVARSELVAQPVNGIKGLLFNIFPENWVGWYVLLIMLVYYWSWMAGFAASIVLPSHAIMAVFGFFLFVYVESSLEEGKGSFWSIIRRNGVTFSVLMIIDNILLTGQFQWNLILIAALLMAFREGHPLDDLKRVVTVMVVASAVAAVGPFLYNQFNQFFFSAAAKIALPLNFEVWSLNFSYLPFILGLLANRTFTFAFFWYAIFGLSKKTRVARSLAWIVMFLFIFASWPSIAPEVNKLHSQYITGATPEQKEFWPNIFRQATTNARGAVISLFQSFSVRTASAYEKKYGELEQTFGFGQQKQEPKLGLTLVQDSTMLKKYDISYRKPEPSFVMRITSPLPAEKPYIEVTGISCKDSQNKLKFGPGVTSKGVTPTEGMPVAVFYSGPDGGAQVKCPVFDASAWESGDYSIAAEVDYKVDATTFLTTAFIREDKDKAWRLAGSDPAVVNKILPAKAEYNNVPVTLTWGPPDLTKSPASIDLKQAGGYGNFLIIIYVSKNTGWGNGEIKAVQQLGLLLPQGVTLALGDSCDFIPDDKSDSGDGRKWYVVNPKQITDKEGKPRFIGDAIRFECGMKVSKEALSGADWAPARFDLSGRFIFTTKLDSITFTVTGGEKAAAAQGTSQPAAPQPPELQV